MSADTDDLLAGLRGLDDADLERVRASYAAIVRRIEHEQEHRRQRQEREMARERAAATDPTPHYVKKAEAVAAARAHFDSEAAALQAVAVNHGCSVDMVQRCLTLARQYHRRQEKAARDRRIMREAARGKTNRAIARLAGCSTATVQRVVSRNKSPGG